MKQLGINRFLFAVMTAAAAPLPHTHIYLPFSKSAVIAHEKTRRGIGVAQRAEQLN